MRARTPRTILDRQASQFRWLLMTLALPILITPSPAHARSKRPPPPEQIPVITHQMELSDAFAARIQVFEEQRGDRPGRIIVFDRASGAELISMRADDLGPDATRPLRKTDVRQNPSGEFSPIIHEDFNFDGVKDFALQHGTEGCGMFRARGPSYRVFLANTARPGRFDFSPAFSRLTQGNCGLFEIDRQTRTLQTMINLGDQRYRLTGYIVEKGQPRPILIGTLSSPGLLEEKTFEERRNGTMVKSTSVTLIPGDFRSPDGRHTLLLKFRLRERNATVWVWVTEVYSVGSSAADRIKRVMHYALTDAEKTVELLHPGFKQFASGDTARFAKRAGFRFSQRDDLRELAFSTGPAHYTVYQTLGPTPRVGVRVNHKGRSHDLEGDPATIQGRLDPPISKPFFNLTTDKLSTATPPRQ